MSTGDNKSIKQRALVLGGGGALGAYEAGVLKALCEKLTQENNKKDGPLFDIVAGTSIGAMNAAVLVSNVVNGSKTWKEAAEELIKFWTSDKNAGKKGLESTPDYGKWWWNEAQKDKLRSDSASASTEAARRYYSVKEYSKHGTPNVCTPPIPKIDSKFGDLDNIWFVHDNKQLQDTIERFAFLPMATKYEEKQPRLLVFAVDAAEGETVVFDSYGKVKRDENGSIIEDGQGKPEYEWKTEYGAKGYEHTIRYDKGITIDHVMASGTVPEFYDYKDVGGNKFWDGGLLSNTPFRELLQAHYNYWINLTEEEEDGTSKVPDLDVYIINLHPSKQPNLATDHDGVRDRLNDITFFDRNSHNDENIARLILDYNIFTTQMNCLIRKAISKITPENGRDELQNEFETILSTITSSKDQKGQYCKYTDLMKCKFELGKVIRIEHKNYTNSVWGKTADFTSETIRRLIKEGEYDAWISLLQDDINSIDLKSPVNIDVKNRLIDKLNNIRDTLEEKEI